MMRKLMGYVRAAFSARPIGMLVPPNWIGLTAFGLLGFITPGFWLLGLGAEMGYLYMMTSSPRFRRYVDATSQASAQQQWQKKLAMLLAQLNHQERQQYEALEARCRTILSQQIDDPASAAQGQGLSRLLWIYLRLLLTRQSIKHIVSEAQSARPGNSLEGRIASLQKQLENQSLGDDLRKSLTGQVEILQQRLEGQEQGRQKLTFLDCELTRIEEQVELIREQAALSADPQSVSQRIDQVAASLGGTTQWIREQQRIYGRVEDLLVEPPMLIKTEPPHRNQVTPPPLPASQRSKEASQE